MKLVIVYVARMQEFDTVVGNLKRRDGKLVNNLLANAHQRRSFGKNSWYGTTYIINEITNVINWNSSRKTVSWHGNMRKAIEGNHPGHLCWNQDLNTVFYGSTTVRAESSHITQDEVQILRILNLLLIRQSYLIFPKSIKFEKYCQQRRSSNTEIRGPHCDEQKLRSFGTNYTAPHSIPDLL